MTEIAITGIGIVCAGGRDREDFWHNLRSGNQAITPIENLDTRWVGMIQVGEVKGLERLVERLPLDPTDYDRPTQLGLLAAHEAIEHAGVNLEDIGPHRSGVVMGTCQGTMPDVVGSRAGATQDAMYAVTDAIAFAFDLGGYRASVSTACSAGANAIAMARHVLLGGEADLMLAGGADALSFFILAGFTSVLALDPQPCAPYSRSGGLNVGEGAAVMVLERVDDAKARGAEILALLGGVGQSSDAYHPAAPDPAGRGAVLAMQRAVAQTGRPGIPVSYVNGHGTGTPANDAMERKAMRAMFGEAAADVPMSSVKGMVGHTLGAAGAIEAAACVLAIRDGMVPPTLHVGERAPDDLDFVGKQGRERTVDLALSNNHAFGGSNTSVALLPPRLARNVVRRRDGVVITGIGAVGSLGVGVSAWADSLAAGVSGLKEVGAFDVSDLRCRIAAEVPSLDHLRLAPPAEWRRMDRLARQSVASTDLAMKDAALTPDADRDENFALLFATSSGSLEAFEQFMEGAQRGRQRVNPFLFPKTPLNAAAGHISVARGLRGPTSTVTTGCVSGALAVMEAVRTIEHGECEIAVVVAGDLLLRTSLVTGHGDEGILTTAGVVRPFDTEADGSALSASTVALVLESEASALRRSAPAYARVGGFGAAGGLPESDGIPPPWGDAISSALDRASAHTGAVQYCVASAPGIPGVDAQEAEALGKILGPEVPVGAPKSITGGLMASDGLVGVLVASLAIRDGLLCPTANLQTPIAPPLAHLRTPVLGARVDLALVDCASVDGNAAAIVLERAAPR